VSLLLAALYFFEFELRTDFPSLFPSFFFPADAILYRPPLAPTPPFSFSTPQLIFIFAGPGPAIRNIFFLHRPLTLRFGHAFLPV